jgi:hypothetical protein
MEEEKYQSEISQKSNRTGLVVSLFVILYISGAASWALGFDIRISASLLCIAILASIVGGTYLVIRAEKTEDAKAASEKWRQN